MTIFNYRIATSPPGAQARRIPGLATENFTALSDACKEDGLQVKTAGSRTHCTATQHMKRLECGPVQMFYNGCNKSELHSRKNYEHTQFRKHLKPRSKDYFVFQSGARTNVKKLTCCFVRV
jgi:hypothetical protein